MLFETFLVVRECPVLRAKHLAHIPRVEPTSCRQEADLRAREGEKGHVSLYRKYRVVESGKIIWMPGVSWEWALVSPCEQEGRKQD